MSEKQHKIAELILTRQFKVYANGSFEFLKIAMFICDFAIFFILLDVV